MDAFHPPGLCAAVIYFGGWSFFFRRNPIPTTIAAASAAMPMATATNIAPMPPGCVPDTNPHTLHTQPDSVWTNSCAPHSTFAPHAHR